MECSDKELSKEAIRDLIGDIECPLIYDIGCYDGSDSAELASLYKDCEVYCFDADKRSQDLFIKKNKGNHKLQLIKSAVGKEIGYVDLHLSDSETRRHYADQTSWSASSSIKAPKIHLDLFPDVNFQKIDKVRCIPLDSFYSSSHHKFIDFIWCDVNGAEEDVVLGGLNTLSNTRFLYIEFSDKEIYEGQINKEKLLSLLPNFELLGVYSFLGNFGNLLLKNKNLCV